ncbi:ParA family protein [Dactylosporangium cerinum]
MSVVSVINYKGGVGKTTLTANIGAELAARGRKVLLVDLDPQASLTFSFYRPAEFESRPTILPWFDGYLATRAAEPLHRYVVSPREVNAVVQPLGGQLDLLAGDLGLIEVDLNLAAALGGARLQTGNPRYLPVHRLIADALTDHAFGGYDAVLIDCAPNFNLVTRTAMVASDHVMVPARPDYLSTRGIDYLRARMSRLVEEYNAIAPARSTRRSSAWSTRWSSTPAPARSSRNAPRSTRRPGSRSPSSARPSVTTRPPSPTPASAACPSSSPRRAPPRSRPYDTSSSS